MSASDETARPYAAAWRVYRRVGWFLIAVVAGLPIVVFPVAALLYHWFGIRVPLGGAGDLWIVVFVGGILWESRWRCPRCGQKFFTGRIRDVRQSRSHCQNCQLPQWAESDPDKVWREL